MKRIIILLLIFISLTAHANTYYVAASGGDDSNPGTIGSPWATWQKAFDTANAGDTVYFRGGTWSPTSEPILNPSESHGNNGTHDNPICFFNYPGEIPILDCINYTATGNKVAVDIKNATYIKFRGLTVRNCIQIVDHQWISGFSWYECGNIYLDQMTVTNIQGYGFWGYNYDTLYMTNCDSYNNVDYLGDAPGGRADGYSISDHPENYGDTLKYTYITGCRAWENSDDGFELSLLASFDVFNNWAWASGMEEGYQTESDGVGFKFGWSDIRVPDKRKLHHNVAAYGRGAGYAEENLLDATHGPVAAIYNNSFYKVRIGVSGSLGFYNCATGYAKTIMRNNVVYASTLSSYFDQSYMSICTDDPQGAYITQDHNTWDYKAESPWWKYNTDVDWAYTGKEDQFLSLDTTGMSGARKADGSLPNIDFMKLRPTSDLIDAGVDVDLDYYGAAPDMGYHEYSPGPQIIADHTIIDDYDNIPQYYIDSVKKMWVSFAGESHSDGIRNGAVALETSDATYAVSVVDAGTPEAYTDTNLRLSRATWGDLNNATGWIYGYGDEDWFYTAPAIARTKAGILYCNTNGPALAAISFVWCYDPNPDGEAYGAQYSAANNEIVEYCETNSIPTKVFYSTGTVDAYVDEMGYQQYLKSDTIRNFVLGDTTRILFDYADILSYDAIDGSPTTYTYDGHTYPIITTTNLTPTGSGHISATGELRLAKAMWWMLARMAGWDGNVTVYSEAEVDSTLTDILTFTLADQTAAATINTANHTVAIEVDYTADITSLTPTITLSYGATVIPASGVAQNFSSPVTYTLTALDGTTTQEWVVTVTQEAAPEEPPASSSKIVKIGGYIIKL